MLMVKLLENWDLFGSKKEKSTNVLIKHIGGSEGYLMNSNGRII